MSAAIEGFVTRGFEPVRDAFIRNFEQGKELGAACCVFHRGEKVVDLWGGIRNASTGARWERDTMVLVYSTTKGMAGLAMALAHSRGLYDYDQRVSTYWPDFAQAGKERITVRQLLAHQAGLFALDEHVDASIVADPDRLATLLARQKPAWEAGTRQAYHGITLGFYESELLRRVDPAHRTLGQFFQQELADPLGLDFYIRLPESIPNGRLATLARPSAISMVTGFPLGFLITAFNHRSNIYRALVVNPGSEIVHDAERVYLRDVEVPSGGGVGTARAIARAYDAFAAPGGVLDLRGATVRALAAPAVPPLHGFHDECLNGEVRFALGFMKPGPTWPFGSASSFGAPGAGGSLGFADPDAGIGYAYVTSRMGTTLTGDPRDVALRDALYACLRATDGFTLSAAGAGSAAFPGRDHP